MLKEKKASQTVIKQITNQPRHFSKMCYFTIFLHHFLAPLGIVILFEIQNNHFSRNKKGEWNTTLLGDQLFSTTWKDVFWGWLKDLIKSIRTKGGEWSFSTTGWKMADNIEMANKATILYKQ